MGKGHNRGLAQSGSRKAVRGEWTCVQPSRYFNITYGIIALISYKHLLKMNFVMLFHPIYFEKNPQKGSYLPHHKDCFSSVTLIITVTIIAIRVVIIVCTLTMS